MTNTSIQLLTNEDFGSIRALAIDNEPYARLTQKGLDWCIQHYVKLPAQMRT